MAVIKKLVKLFVIVCVVIVNTEGSPIEATLLEQHHANYIRKNPLIPADNYSQSCLLGHLLFVLQELINPHIRHHSCPLLPPIYPTFPPFIEPTATPVPTASVPHPIPTLPPFVTSPPTQGTPQSTILTTDYSTLTTSIPTTQTYEPEITDVPDCNSLEDCLYLCKNYLDLCVNYLNKMKIFIGEKLIQNIVFQSNNEANVSPKKVRSVLAAIGSHRDHHKDGIHVVPCLCNGSNTERNIYVPLLYLGKDINGEPVMKVPKYILDLFKDSL